MKYRVLFAASALASLLPAPAMAATFMMRFSGAQFGNTAVATGSFDITDAALAGINKTFGSNPAWTTVSNLTLTITGATSGNGTFTTADFGPTFNFSTRSALDFSRELVGQAQPGGRTFGQLNTSGAAGDFNLFRRTANSAPNGFNYFNLATSGTTSNQMALVSLTAAAVPEPATWAMMLVGFGMVGAASRYRRKGIRVRYA